VCYINKRNNNFNKIKFESLISIGEAASRIGVSIDTLRRWDKSGKLKAIRKNNIRYYSEKEIGVYLNDISAIAFSWLLGNDETEIPKMFYCQDSSIFQSRLERMQQELNNENVSLLTAITGGIGNNSFDHNIGNWPKVPVPSIRITLSRRPEVRVGV
jgi:DNA-binding transcriptional MerR regulator